MGISLTLASGFGALGMVTVRTPCSTHALMSSTLTSLGRVKLQGGGAVGGGGHENERGLGELQPCQR